MTPQDDDRPNAERNLESGYFWVQLTEDQAKCLSSGYVPNGVKSVLRELLDYALQDELMAARPVQKKTKARKNA